MKNTLEGMWGRRKRGGEEGEGEHFYPLQHPKDRSIVMKVVILLRILLRISSIQKTVSIVMKMVAVLVILLRMMRKVVKVFKTGRTQKSWPPYSLRREAARYHLLIGGS